MLGHGALAWCLRDERRRRHGSLEAFPKINTVRRREVGRREKKISDSGHFQEVEHGNTSTSADPAIFIGGGESQKHRKTASGSADLIGSRLVARPSLQCNRRLFTVTSRALVKSTPIHQVTFKQLCACFDTFARVLTGMKKPNEENQTLYTQIWADQRTRTPIASSR